MTVPEVEGMKRVAQRRPLVTEETPATLGEWQQLVIRPFPMTHARWQDLSHAP